MKVTYTKDEGDNCLWVNIGNRCVGWLEQVEKGWQFHFHGSMLAVPEQLAILQAINNNLPPLP
jgi:hypothetical protein